MKRFEGRVAVLKLGGSVLRDRGAYRRATWFIEERLRDSQADRLVVVVSAEHGLTNALQRTARSIAPTPSARSLDLLWSIGELRSVALLALNLERRGISAVGLNVHETGVRVERNDPRTATVASDVLEQELSDRPVVVVPGFLATNCSRRIVSLGRGGSDLTAVLLAIHLAARECELVKAVGGCFTADPALDTSAKHIPSLSYNCALRMAAAGSQLVQLEALERASRANLRIRIRGARAEGRATIIGPAPAEEDVADMEPVAHESPEPEGCCEDKPV